MMVLNLRIGLDLIDTILQKFNRLLIKIISNESDYENEANFTLAYRYGTYCKLFGYSTGRGGNETETWQTRPEDTSTGRSGL